MSRIGKKEITIPDGVTVSVANDTVTVKGPKGELKQELKELVKVTVNAEDKTVSIGIKEGLNRPGSFQGLYRSLIQNMVDGVTQGYKKTLEVIGVGYRVQVTGKKLVMNIGYNKPVEIESPEGISIEAPNANSIIVSGIDKQKVGQMAAEIRSVRKPEPYKGKGIKYSDEVIRRKEGKAVGGK